MVSAILLGRLKDPIITTVSFSSTAGPTINCTGILCDIGILNYYIVYVTLVRGLAQLIKLSIKMAAILDSV